MRKRSRITRTTRVAGTACITSAPAIPGDSVDKCYSPSSVWNDKSESTNQSHELRLSSPTDWRMRFVAGLFYEERELNANTDWLLQDGPGMPGHRCVRG